MTKHYNHGSNINNAIESKLIPNIYLLETSLDAYELLTIFQQEHEVIFLDSSKEHKDWGQYSYIVFNPFKTFRYKSGLYILDNQTKKGDPFDMLNKIINEYKVINESRFPFVGGGIGYFSYDLVRDMEKLPELSEEIVDIPTCYFNFYDQVIIYDHQNSQVYVSLLNIFDDGIEKLAYIQNKIHTAKSTAMSNRENCKQFMKTTFKSPFTRESYMSTIDRMRQYIKDGHIYIANLTHTFKAEVSKEPMAIYGYLRNINPAPFSAYMQLEGFNILSSSPERFLKIQRGYVETRPIKGTRPRGKNREEDEKNKQALLESEKDKSELLMIVDLERNDLSKVCKPCSVKVEGLFDLEVYATVYHLVATVRGELREDVSAVDCIKACFPGGSITGTPKVRAMEIIEELEPTRRNLYTGCIGYLGFDGNADMNIVIRTILQKDGFAYIGVGGGITWESEASEEYQETLDKAKALFESINMNTDDVVD